MIMIRPSIAVALSAFVFFAVVRPAAADDASDIEATVAAQLRNYGDKAPMLFSNESITVDGKYAFADMTLTKGLVGEQALLVKKNGAWTILVQGGGEIAPSLAIAHGVPPIVANDLLAPCRSKVEHNSTVAHSEVRHVSARVRFNGTYVRVIYDAAPRRVCRRSPR